LQPQLHFICTLYSINSLRFTKIRVGWNGELPLHQGSGVARMLAARGGQLSLVPFWLPGAANREPNSTGMLARGRDNRDVTRETGMLARGSQQGTKLNRDVGQPTGMLAARGGQLSLVPSKPIKIRIPQWLTPKLCNINQFSVVQTLARRPHAARRRLLCGPRTLSV